jgi:hypothetical protein
MYCWQPYMCHRIRYKHNYTTLHTKTTDDEQRDRFTVCHICKKIHYCNVRVTTMLSPLHVSQESETGVHRAALCKIQVFWHMTLCHRESSLHHFKRSYRFILRVKQFLKQALVNTAAKRYVSQKRGNLGSCATMSFSKTLLHYVS